MEPSSTGTLIAIRDLEKRYGATQALAGISLDISPGEIHAFIGSNGSGKSTAIKILSGVERADAGTIGIGEQALDARRMSAEHVRALGVRFIHQQGSTFGPMSVAENFAAGAYPIGALGHVKWGELRRQASTALARFDVDLNPREMVSELRPGKRQLLAIVRALDSLGDAGRGVLVLDEPTASLAQAEVQRLQILLRNLVDAGYGVLYVTHRLEELPGFASRVTVLRDGRIVQSMLNAEITHSALVEAISGGLGQATAVRSSRPIIPPKGGLTVNGLAGGPLRDVNLTLNSGEVVGLAGLAGSGRSSLLQMLFGVLRPTSGEIALEQEILNWRGGLPYPDVAYVPEDRTGDAAFLILSIRENLTAPFAGRFWRRGLFRNHQEMAVCDELIGRYSIRGATSKALMFKNLSGGNQQKAIIARWMATSPKYLLLDEPTQGIDVRARAEIHAHVREAATRGMAALVASSDANELASLCDRVLVLSGGTVSAELQSSQLTGDAIERAVQQGQPQGAGHK